MNPKLSVAVCGNSSAGKGTVSRLFAKQHGIMYVDVGLIFRFGTHCAFTGAVGGLEDLVSALNKGHWRYCWDGGKPHIETEGTKLYKELISPETSELTSKASAQPRFFWAFLEIAEAVLSSHGSVIADGRSVGSVIMPNADFKFFITADLRTRAERRMTEYATLGFNLTVEEVMKGLESRDLIDSSRALDPLRVPEGAKRIDTSRLSPEEVVSMMSNYVFT